MNPLLQLAQNIRAQEQPFKPRRKTPVFSSEGTRYNLPYEMIHQSTTPPPHTPQSMYEVFQHPGAIPTAAAAARDGACRSFLLCTHDIWAKAAVKRPRKRGVLLVPCVSLHAYGLQLDHRMDEHGGAISWTVALRMDVNILDVPYADMQAASALHQRVSKTPP